MKKTLFLLMASLAVLGATSRTALAQFQQTRTAPAGYLTTSLAPSPDGVARAYTPLSCPLHAAAIYSGAVSAVSGNTLTLSNASLPDLSTAPYLIHITSAANTAAVGMSFLVTASTGTTVTASPSGLPLASYLAANDQVLVYPANTLGSLFGATDSAVKLQGSSSAAGSDLVYLFDGTAWDGYFYKPGTGWLLSGDATQTVQNNAVLLPDRAMLVGRISTTALDATANLLSGNAPQNAQIVTLAAPGTTYAANPLPTPVTLAQLGLSGNGGWKDAATAGDADTAYLFAAANWQTFFHITGYGWVLDSDPNYATQDTTPVPALGAVLISRQSASAHPAIQVPLTYTVN